jgi:hypothetical protein
MGAIGVTFFALLAAPVSAQAAAPLAAEQSLTLYSPVAGIDMPSTPAGPEDVLDKLRRGFELTYEDNNRKWFAKHPDYLNRVFTRAQRYLPYILAELERRDMPQMVREAPRLPESRVHPRTALPALHPCRARTARHAARTGPVADRRERV